MSSSKIFPEEKFFEAISSKNRDLFNMGDFNVVTENKAVWSHSLNCCFISICVDIKNNYFSVHEISFTDSGKVRGTRVLDVGFIFDDFDNSTISSHFENSIFKHVSDFNMVLSKGF